LYKNNFFQFTQEKNIGWKMSFYLFISISFYLFISILCAIILCMNWVILRHLKILGTRKGKIWGWGIRWPIKVNNERLRAHPIQLFFLFFLYFGVRLGHFISNENFLYVTSMQAYQQKTEKRFIGSATGQQFFTIIYLKLV